MISSADRRISALPFSNFMACILFAWRTHAGAQTGAKNPARIISAGHDAALEYALMYLNHSSL
jgi:hypothetical protein